MTHNTDDRVTGQRGKTRAEVLAPDVARLVASGMSRNAIAVELGCSAGTVTNAARVAGVEFDRAAPRAAVEAAQVDAKVDRAILEGKLRKRAHEALDLLDMTIPRDARDLTVVAGILLDKSLRLVEFDQIGNELQPSDALLWINEMLGTTVRSESSVTTEQLDAVTSVAEFEQLTGQ